MFSIREVLDIAIRIEENGEAVYRGAMAQVSDPALAALLEWMAEEEARHARWFAAQKQDWASASDSPLIEEMNQQLLNELIADQSFSLDEIDFTRVRDVQELLRVFIRFEQDTRLFYQMLQPFMENEAAAEGLAAIIEEEERHVERLKEFLGSETVLTESMD